MTRRNPRHQGKHPQGQQRGQGGSYWLVGRHAVLAALRNPQRRIVQLWLARPPEGEIAQALAERDIKQVRQVEARQLEQISPDNAPHQGIAAEVHPLPGVSLEDIENPTCLMVLDQVTDPHNVGAILRSCAAFGVDALVMPRDNSPGESAVMAKAASGALEIVPIAKVTNLASALKELKEQGFWVLGLDGTAQTDLYDAPSYDKTVFVMGAEGEGMRRLTRELCDVLVRLPMSGRIESLNVSNAAAIALYEVSRKR